MMRLISKSCCCVLFCFVQLYLLLLHCYVIRRKRKNDVFATDMTETTWPDQVLVGAACALVEGRNYFGRTSTRSVEPLPPPQTCERFDKKVRPTFGGGRFGSNWDVILGANLSTTQSWWNFLSIRLNRTWYSELHKSLINRYPTWNRIASDDLQLVSKQALKR